PCVAAPTGHANVSACCCRRRSRITRARYTAPTTHRGTVKSPMRTRWLSTPFTPDFTFLIFLPMIGLSWRSHDRRLDFTNGSKPSPLSLSEAQAPLWRCKSNAMNKLRRECRGVYNEGGRVMSVAMVEVEEVVEIQEVVEVVEETRTVISSEEFRKALRHF